MCVRESESESKSERHSRICAQEGAPLQGYLARKKQPPPKDHHRDLGIVLL